MKKTILKFIKSPAFDFILFVFILVALFVLYGIYCIHAAADTFYNSDGYLVAESSGYKSNVDYTLSYPSDTPVIGDGASVPSGYNLIATAIYTDDGNRCRKYWIYYPSSADSPTIRNTTTPPTYNYSFSAALGSEFYVIRNRVSNSGVYTSMTPETTSSLQSVYFKFTFLAPVYDSNGNLLRPENQIYFNLNSSYDTETKSLFFNASSSSYTSNSVHFYLFPSSVSISSGSTSTLISEQYFSEIPVVTAELMEELGLGVQYKIWEANKDISVFSLLPELVFLDTSTSTRHGLSFDPSSYGVPYLDLGSKSFHSTDNNIYLTQTYCLNVPNMDKSKSGVYLYNDLCVVAVVDYENVFFTARFDFNRNILKSYGVVAPSYPSPSDSYSSGTVSDLQDLADYLQYLYTTNNSNNIKQDNNIIAYLQAIDWSGYMANGVAAGMANFLPQLSAEFDTMFNGLFTDFFVPDLDDIEEQIDEDEEAFSDKFQWVHDIKAEVNFIVHTPLAADDDEFVFKATIQKYSIGEVIFFDSEWVDGSTRLIVKRVITVFCTLALIVYIFKTLPSTLGNMPSD